MCEVMERYMAEAANEAAKKATVKANIRAVINMLHLNIDETQIKALYPSEFDEGKKRFLEGERNISL